MQAAPLIAEYAPLILAGAGTALQMSAAQKQQEDQRRVLNRQFERDDEAAAKSTQEALMEGQRYAQPAREQALQEAEDQTYAQTQADLQGAGGATINAAGDAGNVSEDFLKTKAARAIEETTRLSDAAREAAKARAPGQLQMDDRLSMARMAGDLGSLWGTTKNMATANGMEAQSVEQPGYGNLGKVASAVGSGMAYGGYGQGEPDTGVPPNPNVPRRRPAGINFGAR